MNSENNIHIKFLKGIFLTGLMITPFIFWPFWDIAYEVPKVHFILRWIELLGITAFVSFKESVDSHKSDSKLILLVILYLVIATSISLLGVDFTKSFWGNYYRVDGIFSLIHYVVLFLFIVQVFRKNWIAPTVRTISLTAVLLSIFSIIDAFLLFVINIRVPFFEDWYGGIGVFFGNPNFLAGYLLVTLPLTYYTFFRSKNKYLKLALVSQITAIYLTKSTAGLLGVLFFAFLLYTITHYRKRLIYGITVMLSLLIVSAIFQISSKMTDSIKIAESRDRIIVKGLLSYASRPLTGWGWANYDHAFKNADYPIKIDNDAYVDKAHSHFLEILVTIGPIGLLIYFMILARSYLILEKQKTETYKAILLTLVMFIVHSQTNVISVSEEILFWIILGIAAKSGGNDTTLSLRKE